MIDWISVYIWWWAETVRTVCLCDKFVKWKLYGLWMLEVESECYQIQTTTGLARKFTEATCNARLVRKMAVAGRCLSTVCVFVCARRLVWTVSVNELSPRCSIVRTVVACCRSNHALLTVTRSWRHVSLATPPQRSSPKPGATTLVSDCVAVILCLQYNLVRL